MSRKVRCPYCEHTFVPERRNQWMPPFVVGSNTSYDAAVSMLKESKSLRVRVFAYIKNRGANGATTEEIERASGMKHQTISARVWELSRMNMIEPFGYRRNSSGRLADVWLSLDNHPGGSVIQSEKEHGSKL